MFRSVIVDLNFKKEQPRGWLALVAIVKKRKQTQEAVTVNEKHNENNKRILILECYS